MNILLYLLLGLLAGVFSGLIGIGGAIIIIPSLVFVFGLSQHTAQGTTLALMVPPIGLLAAWTYYKSGFVDLKIHHVQFNVVRKEDLVKARENPEAYRSLVVRVAGYTAYFTELADDIQQEIIARTSYA